MDHKVYADEDPRKAIATKINQVVAALKARVLIAVSTARAASQEAHDLALDVSSGAKLGQRIERIMGRARSLDSVL